MSLNDLGRHDHEQPIHVYPPRKVQVDQGNTDAEMSGVSRSLQRDIRAFIFGICGRVKVAVE